MCSSDLGNSENAVLIQIYTALTVYLLLAYQKFLVEIQRDLDDDEVFAVLRKESKKIADSIEQFKRMGRDDLLEKEQYQFEVLESYLPQLMSRDDIEAVVEKKVADLGVSSVTEMGKVMGVVMNELKGKADGGLVKDIVQKVLSQ